MKRYLGIDIGGTKCALVLGDEQGRVLHKVRFETLGKDETLAHIFAKAQSLIELAKSEGDEVSAIGVSCGGPLDSRLGLIQSPPNLPGWDNVPIVQMLKDRFCVPTALCNDANACALAEYRFGAGKGSKNMIFLTCGTGMGAGLILDGKLYAGTNGNAGEVGHMRLADYGPVGYGKAGSFEGFCSGGGIKQVGQTLAREALQCGKTTSFCRSYEEMDQITARSLALAAETGDEVALRVWEIVAEKLGRGVSLLIDLLNPERIVIGSIFERSEQLLRKKMEEVISREVLPQSGRVCRVVPAALGDEIGDYAAIAVAMREGF